MSGMFAQSNFNQKLDIDTSKVTKMSDMFCNSEFNQP